MNRSCFERIEDDMLSDHQRRISFNGEPADHFRIVRAPTSVREFTTVIRTNSRVVIWMDDERVFISNKFIGLRDWAKSLFYLQINRLRFRLAGQSDHEVAQVAAFLCTLKYLQRDRYISMKDPTVANLFDFNVFTAKQIASLLRRPLQLFHVNVPKELSIKLASQPYPINMMLSDCSFADDGEAFLAALEKRKTSFGTLILNGCSLMGFRFLRRLNQVTTLELLQIISYKATVGPEDLLPFASKAKKVEFEVGIPGHSCFDKSFTIVPKRFILKIMNHPTRFVSNFLRAAANLTEMGLVMQHAPSEQIWHDLVAAVGDNQNLKELELGILDRCWMLKWEDFMLVIGRHQGLCKLKLHSKYEPPSVEDLKLVDSLVSMLQSNRNNIDVDFVGHQKDVWTTRLKESLRRNRYYQGSKSLSKEGKRYSAALLRTAIMECTHNDAQRTSSLLSDNVSALCMLLEWINTHSEVRSTSTPETKPTEERVSVRQRTDSTSLDVDLVTACIHKAIGEALEKQKEDIIEALTQENNEESTCATTESEPSEEREPKRQRLDTAELDVELITACIQKDLEETMEKQKEDIIEALTQENDKLFEDIRKSNQDNTSVSQFLHYSAAQNRADCRVISQNLEQRMADLQTEMTHLKRCLVKCKHSNNDMSSCRNEAPTSSCTIS